VLRFRHTAPLLLDMKCIIYIISYSLLSLRKGESLLSIPALHSYAMTVSLFTLPFAITLESFQKSHIKGVGVILYNNILLHRWKHGISLFALERNFRLVSSCSITQPRFSYCTPTQAILEGNVSTYIRLRLCRLLSSTPCSLIGGYQSFERTSGLNLPP
jgi:hypothetical protein